jgi:endoglucanase Acf2
MIFGTRHNSNALANKTTGDQNLQVRVNGAGAFVTFHVVPDDSLVTTLGGASPLGDGAGGVFMGSVDVKAEVTANGTYNFQWTTAGVDVAALLLYDVQVGLIVTYSL